jgi:hypothetical protein
VQLQQHRGRAPQRVGARASRRQDREKRKLGEGLEGEAGGPQRIRAGDRAETRRAARRPRIPATGTAIAWAQCFLPLLLSVVVVVDGTVVVVAAVVVVVVVDPLCWAITDWSAGLPERQPVSDPDWQPQL